MRNNNRCVFKIIVFALILQVTNLASAQVLSDAKATKETKALYKNLHVLSRRYILFGHQDDLAYGVHWKYRAGRSDVKDVVNEYPAVYGWDLARIEHDSANNIDGVPFSKMRAYIQQAYARGGVSTLSWHFDNPLTAGSAWDTTHGAVQAILPGGSKHHLYTTWLDRAALFIQTLKGSRNECIPVLFRPFHELTGHWFWWCRNTTDAALFKQVWRFTIEYLRNKKQLHNLIVVYNTAGFTNEKDFLEYYPGDDLVDMVSFDRYQYQGQSRESFVASMRQQVQQMVEVAKQKNKLSAIAETGFEAVPDSVWWTQTLQPIVKDFPLSYVLVWRNAGYMPSMKKMHYYAPYKGQASENDFKKMYRSGFILFERALKQKNIYQ